VSGRMVTKRSPIFQPRALCVWLRLAGAKVS
jgi:hypothetical protein